MDNFKKYLNRPIVSALIVFALFFSTFILIFTFANGDPIPDDQYFHFKYAYLLRTEGLDAVNHFKWIQAGPEASDGSRYTVSLFQASLVPFTFLKDWVFGIRVAEALYASVVIAIVYYIMRKERVKYPIFYALFLASSSYFIMRILLGRALVIMLGLIFLEMYFAIRKKYIPLLVVTIFHVLWHQNTYFMPIIIICIVESSRILLEKKIYIKNIVATVVGVIIGMMFFPGFPKSLISWMINLFGIRENSVGTSEGALGGSELALIDLSKYFAGNIAMFVLFVLSIGLVIFLFMKLKQYGFEKLDGNNKVKLHWIYSLLIFLFAVIIGSISVTGRFFDFVFPTIILLIGFTSTLLVDLKLIVFKKSTRESMGVFVWIFVVILFIGSMISVYKKSNKFDYQPARLAAEWIDENSVDGEKVFLHNWSHFNMMFFANSNNVYSMGIEPYGLRGYDEGLYWKYYNIFSYVYYCELEKSCADELNSSFMEAKSEKDKEVLRKRNSENIINSVKNDFGSRFIVSDSSILNEVLSFSPELIEDKFEVKSDKFNNRPHMNFVIYKLK